MRAGPLPPDIGLLAPRLARGGLLSSQAAAPAMPLLSDLLRPVGSPAEGLTLPPGGEDPTLRPDEQAGRSALLQLVQLRWIACIGQLVTVLGVHYLLGVHLPLRAMLAIIVGLALFNLASGLRARTARAVGSVELLAGLGVDLLVLTALLALSGGVNNPFVFLYLPQVAVAALLLPRRLVWLVLAAATLAIAALARWHWPLQWNDGPVPPLSLAYVLGLLLCFVICASLMVRVIVHFGHTLRRRDERLAALRQRAAEEDHIVRMGLLASGAAHELSTPLATLSVILGDWSHMGPIAAEPELRQDLDEMQAQVQRCKTIITGILMSAGDARAEITGTTTLPEFLADVLAEWCRRRGVDAFQAELGPLPDQPIVTDAGLRQMVTNLLDNALEAAPQALPRLLADADDQGQLRLRIQDRGPGFAPEVLANFGRPYHSTKGKPGGGLGVFLSVNLARKLGGNVQARNLAHGGAEVTVTLPLDALVPEPDEP
ncbi:ATP-binding protein [Aquabacterium sp.]|uniref:ATP-binding protein n=1 Tax=Aquabacterium sp. TaxID=1872578 RepID=UPI0037847673